MKKKSFKDNPAMAFITAPEPPEGQTSIEDYLEEKKPPQKAEKDPLEGIIVPPGYRLAKEPKSKRINLLIRPSLLQTLKEEAAARDLSVTQLIDDLLTEAVKRL